MHPEDGIASKLRSLMIDCVSPTFETQTGRPGVECATLNQEQVLAVSRYYSSLGGEPTQLNILELHLARIFPRYEIGLQPHHQRLHDTFRMDHYAQRCCKHLAGDSTLIKRVIKRLDWELLMLQDGKLQASVLTRLTHCIDTFCFSLFPLLKSCKYSTLKLTGRRTQQFVAVCSA